jgi:putative transposase
MDSSKPSAAAVRDILAKSYGITVSEATLCRYINRIPKCVLAKPRMGENYYHNKYETYIERDYTVLRSMEMICGDYMTEDILCRQGDRVFRARLCGFEDMRSRVIVGWSLQLTANSVGVVRALKMAFERYGLPDKVYVDNGKEFKNYWLCGDEWKLRRTKIDPESLERDAGILNECGVKVVFCHPYSAQSKPIERFWRTFHERFDKFETTYTGSNTTDRPEETKVYRSNIEDMKNVDITLIPTFEEIEERIGRFVVWYNAEWPHTGQGMDGNVPDAVFAANAGERRDIPEQLKKYLFTLRYVKVVQRNGVKLDGVWYLTKEMQAHIGEKVEVRRGLDSTDTVHIFSIPDRVYLFDAENPKYSGMVQEDIEKVKKIRKDMNELHAKYNRKKAEYESGIFKTPAETYAEEAETRQVVGGDPLPGNTAAPALTLVPAGKPKRKLKGIFDD